MSQTYPKPEAISVIKKDENVWTQENTIVRLIWIELSLISYHWSVIARVATHDSPLTMQSITAIVVTDFATYRQRVADKEIHRHIETYRSIDIDRLYNRDDLPSLLFLTSRRTSDEWWSHRMDDPMGWVRLRFWFTELVLLKAILMPIELWNVNICDNEVIKTIDSKQVNHKKQLIWKTDLKDFQLLYYIKRAPNILNDRNALKIGLCSSLEVENAWL